ncbi:uncharacterized protein [Diadema antillarum]|uniref:uncharacterized protein n=1 Tax=Diadema antillarum TaxID=105358 RepID=UPI003A8786E0
MKTKRQPLICMMSPLSQTKSQKKIVRRQPIEGKRRKKLFSQPRSPVTDLAHESSRVLQSEQPLQQQQTVSVKKKRKTKNPINSENEGHSDSLPKGRVKKVSKVKSKKPSKKMPSRKRQKSFGEESPVTSPIRLSASATLCHSTKRKRQKMSIAAKDKRKLSPAMDSGCVRKHQGKNLPGNGTDRRGEAWESNEERFVNRFMKSKRLEQLLNGGSRNGSRKTSDTSGDSQDLHSVKCNGTGAKHKNRSPKPRLQQTVQQASNPHSGEVDKSSDCEREASSHTSQPITTRDQNEEENNSYQYDGIVEETQKVDSLESVHAVEGDGLAKSQNSCQYDSSCQTPDKESESPSKDGLPASSQTQRFPNAISQRSPQPATERTADEKTADPYSSSQSLFSDLESGNEADAQDVIRNKVNDYLCSSGDFASDTDDITADDSASQISQTNSKYTGNSDVCPDQEHAFQESHQKSEISLEGGDKQTIRGATSTSENMYEMQTRSCPISAQEMVNVAFGPFKVEESLNGESSQTVGEDKQNEQSSITEDDEASDLSSFLFTGSPRERETGAAVRFDDQTPTIRETEQIQNGETGPSLTPNVSGVESSFTAMESSCASCHLTPGQRKTEGTESEDSDCRECEEIEAGQSHLDPIDEAAAVHLESLDMAEEKWVCFEDGKHGNDQRCSLNQNQKDGQEICKDTSGFLNCETSPAVQERSSSKGQSSDQDHGSVCRRVSKDRFLFECYCHEDFAFQIVEALQSCPKVDHSSLLTKCDQSVVQIRGKFNGNGGQCEVGTPFQTVTIKTEEDSDREQIPVCDSGSDTLWGSKDRETHVGISSGVYGKETEQCISQDSKDGWIAIPPDEGHCPNDTNSSESDEGASSQSPEGARRVPLLVPDGRGAGGDTMTLFISESDLSIINQQLDKVDMFMYGLNKVDSFSSGMLAPTAKRKNTEPCISNDLHHLKEGGKKLKKKERSARKIKKGKKKGADVISGTSRRRLTDDQTSFSTGSSVVHPEEWDPNQTITESDIEHNMVEIDVNKKKKKRKSKKDPSDACNTCLKVKKRKKVSTESTKKKIKLKMQKSTSLGDTSCKVSKNKSKERKQKEPTQTLSNKSRTDSSTLLKKKKKRTKSGDSKKILPKRFSADRAGCAIRSNNEATYCESISNSDVQKSPNSSKSKTKQKKEKTKDSKSICPVLSDSNKDKKTKTVIRTMATEKIKSKKRKITAECKDSQVADRCSNESGESVLKEPKSGVEGKFGRNEDCGKGDQLIISDTLFKRRSSNTVSNDGRKSSGNVGIDMMSDDVEQSEGDGTAEINGERIGQKAGLSCMQQTGKVGKDSKESEECGKKSKKRLKKDSYVDPIMGDLSEWVERWLPSPVSCKGSLGGKCKKAKDRRAHRKMGEAGGSKGNTPDVSANASQHTAVPRESVDKKKKKEKKLEVRRGSLRGTERKSNERKWQELSHDREKVAAEKMSSPKSTSNAVTCHTFKSVIDNHLKQLKRGSNGQKGSLLLDDDMDSDSSSDSFIDFISFPDVFPA